MSAAAQAGVCRFCGATEAQVDGDKLCWMSRARDCCNKYACRKAFLAEPRKKAARPAKPKSEFALMLAEGWGYGAATMELQRKRRKALRLRKKGKAA